MTRALKPVVKLDRAGTWRCEVLEKWVTKMHTQNGSWEEHHSCWLLAVEGKSEIECHAYAARRSREGITTRVITHEQHVEEAAAITRDRRSQAAKWAWEDRRRKQAREKAAKFPPLKVLP